MNRSLSSLAFFGLLVFSTHMQGMEQATYALDYAKNWLTNSLFHTLDQQLFLAAEAGNLAEVKRLLQEPAINVNYRHPETADEDTVLLAAIRYPDVVHALLEDEKLDVTFDDHWSALCKATEYPLSLRLLLAYQKGGKLRPHTLAVNESPAERIALCTAFRNGRWASALELSSFPGLNLNLTRVTNYGYPLYHLVNAPSEQFNRAGTALNENDGAWPMLHSIIFNLIEKGLIIDCRLGDPESRTYEFATAIEFPRSENPLTMGSRVWPLLCAFGAHTDGLHEREIALGDVHSVQDQLSALLWKRIEFKKAQIDDLLVAGASIVGTDTYTSLTPCMILAAQGRVEALQDLLSWYPEIDINARCCNGWQTLHFAAYNGRTDVLRFLLSLSDIDVLPRTDSGLTPYAVAQLGAQARARAALQKTPDLSACGVIDEYCVNRKAVLLAFYRMLTDPSVGTRFPKDIIRLLARLYRLKPVFANNTETGLELQLHELKTS